MAPLPLLILPGDGIGQEVMAEVRRIVDWFTRMRGHDFQVEEAQVGGAAFDASGTPLADETLQAALRIKTVLFGAVGGPQYDSLPFAVKPERGLLRLRKEMALFANLRPALCFDALVEASSLKPQLVSGLDLLIVRELTGGVYFGEPRGIEDLGQGLRRAVNTQVYDSREIQRVARVAFELVRQRRSQLHSAEKHNVMESGQLWKEEVTALHAAEFSDVVLEHILADNCAMQLVRAPKQFDVILTDNLFGDLLSDVAAMLTGSLGMLPSASLGATAPDGTRMALYEPVHGSAPDIAGQNKANPLACILSFAMALRYSFDLSEDAALLEQAVEAVLAEGARTADIMTPGASLLSCTAMGDAVLQKLAALHAH